MSTASVTNTFVDATTAEAAEVNENFDDLVSYINTNCIVKDGSLALTGLLSGPDPTVTPPTANAHLTPKLYVDDRVGMKTDQQTTALHTSTNTSYQTVDTVTITNPAKAVNVQAWCSGYAHAIAFCDRVELEFAVSFDNGVTYNASPVDLQEIYASNASADYLPLAACVRKTGTPNGDIKIRARFKSRTTTGSTLHDFKIEYIMFKTVTV